MKNILSRSVCCDFIFTTTSRIFFCFIILQGSGSSYGKASRLTTVDRGAGYDASDSFIDDTEAVSFFFTLF